MRFRSQRINEQDAGLPCCPSKVECHNSDGLLALERDMARIIVSAASLEHTGSSWSPSEDAVRALQCTRRVRGVFPGCLYDDDAQPSSVH